MDHKFIVEVNGKRIFASVCPCSWMYPRTNMNVQLSLTETACNAASHFHRWPTPYADCTNEELKSVILDVVKADGFIEALEKQVADWDAEAAAYKAQRDAEMKIEQAQHEAECAKQKAAGMTHHFKVVVHPESGDDFMLSGFGQNLTKAYITSRYKRQHRGAHIDAAVWAL